jgi:esterase/lipase superfamily enzyme
MKRNSLRLERTALVTLTMLLLSSSLCSAQHSNGVDVTWVGTVAEASGIPVPGVEVALADSSGVIVAVAVSDSMGAFFSDSLLLNPGPYTTWAKSRGLASDSLTYVVRPDNEVQHIGGAIVVHFPVQSAGDEPNYARMLVFYATDRGRTSKTAPAEIFGTDRGNLSFGVCEVSIPRDHRPGEIERPSILSFDFHEDPEKHVVLLKVTPQQSGTFFGAMREKVNSSPRRDAFVFIHGYSVSFESAAHRAAQMAYDLKFRGAPIFYSWPSRGSLLHYTTDEEAIRRTERHLREFLELVRKNSGAASIHLIAHSMGNRALVNALERIGEQMAPSDSAKFHQVILTAPDIDRGQVEDVAQQLCRTAKRVTLYASSNDVAMMASRVFHSVPRAGEAGGNLLLVRPLDTIDATRVDTSLVGHSYFADSRSIISDIFCLLTDGVGPQDRISLEARTRNGHTYWAFP